MPEETLYRDEHVRVYRTALAGTTVAQRSSDGAILALWDDAEELMTWARESEMDVRVFDNGGVSFDRYTAIFPDGEMLGIGDTGNVPNGFCMHVGNVSERREGWPYNDAGETETPFSELPEPVQRAIRAEWDGGYA